MCCQYYLLEVSFIKMVKSGIIPFGLVRHSLLVQELIDGWMLLPLQYCGLRSSCFNLTFPAAAFGP